MEPIWKPIHRALRAGAVLIAHALIAALLILLVRGIEVEFYYLWGTDSPLFFDIWPVRYLFDALEFSIISVFIWFGFWEAVEIFRD